jgi:hypothetical protein
MISGTYLRENDGTATEWQVKHMHIAALFEIVACCMRIPNVWITDNLEFTSFGMCQGIVHII